MADEVGAALALARIEAKMDRLGDRVDAVLSSSADHEARIRVLEAAPVVTTRMLTSVVLVGTALASIIPVINLVHIGA